jgi:hypothetical protein
MNPKNAPQFARLLGGPKCTCICMISNQKLTDQNNGIAKRDALPPMCDMSSM